MEQSEYKGYIINVYNNLIHGIGFKIVERLPSGKFKCRRNSNCNQYTGKRTNCGEKLYTRFDTEQEALDRAKNYIDNHIHPWAESPHNPANNGKGNK